ncbi:MAG: threonine ammonia-lyase [Promethearchaeota archaeon]
MSNQDYLTEIQNIREFFSDLVHFTPLELNHTFSVMSSNKVYLKLENFQRTGSFKIRGAYNKISRLTNEQKKAGVITASAGNHGQAVALAAKISNIRSIVVVPEGAPIVKIEAIKNYNPLGEVIEYGQTYDEAYQKALEIKKEKNCILIPAFNDLDIIKGQATIGYEILKQLPDTDYIFCPIGGGGLISGISSYCKQKNKNIKIIGVQSENAPSMHESFRKNKISLMQLKETICDGIAVKQPGDVTYDMIKKYIDDIVLVSDEEVANTILLLLERAKLFVEGAGAAALAAILYNKIKIQNKKVVAVISGGNLTPNLLNRIITKGLIKGGRLVKFKTKIPDIPGALMNVLKIIAEEKGNIISITHDRERLELEYKMTEVVIELETRDFEHINQILANLKEHYQIDILKF